MPGAPKQPDVPHRYLEHLSETLGDGVGALVLFWFDPPKHTQKKRPEATAVSAKNALDALRGRDGAYKENAERDMQKLFTHLGLSLPVPIRSMEHPDQNNDTKLLTTYHIQPQDWVKHWMDDFPQLLGGHSGDPGANFDAFWQVYRLQHPQHKVFAKHSHHLHRVVPLCIHGDEGRAVKRCNYLVLSMESPLGSLEDLRLGSCSCAKEMASRHDLPSYGEDSNSIQPEVLRIAKNQITNYIGHSYLSRWLLFSIHGSVYKKHPYIVDTVVTELTNQFQKLFHDGVVLRDGEAMYAAVIHIKGDMDFHKKLMNLTRCYGNLGRVRALRICHACFAGESNHPFEDYSETPRWANTLYLERPWMTDQPPALSRLPYDDSAPEKILAGDLFHIHKLGVGRDVVGGILIILLRLKFFDHPGSSCNIDDRFARAHTMFSLWCKAEGKSPGLRSFTKRFFNMQTLVSAPWSNSKGSDTVLLLQWLVFTLKLNIQSPVVAGYDLLLQQMLQVCQSCLDLKMVHHHKLWMDRPCAKKFYVAVMTLLRGYVVLGRRSLDLGIRGFIQKPKHHALHHIALEVRYRLVQGDTLIANPQMTACEMNEDFMGRISRLSRRVGFRLVDLRVAQRYFLKVRALVNKRRSLKFQGPKKKKARAGQ